MCAVSVSNPSTSRVVASGGRPKAQQGEITMNASIVLAIGAGIAATSTSVASLGGVTPHSLGVDTPNVTAESATA
jgi:hypothetical protein